MEECFGDLSPCVHALETGLSSDPPMNRRLSALDGHVLVSNSDAHSPRNWAGKPICCPVQWLFRLKTALDTGEGFGAPSNFTRRKGNIIWTATGTASAA
jgi:hypothetical protein